MSQYHFLLGGQDLEMLEIRALLESHQQSFTDKKLGWGASIDAYQSIIAAQPDWHFVGIELTVAPTSKLPRFYTEIDHHNEKVHLPSSIEQIAQLLGVELTRYQQLVAANDRGYKPAMRAMGASEEEIQHIRRLDRQAQGVTDEMERLAEASLQDARMIKGILVLKTPLDKFSPIVDRIEEKKILIYNENILNYYGKGIDLLAKKYKNLIAQKKAYYGGGDSGYFGIAKGVFSTDELTKVVQNIIDYVSENPS